MSTDYRLLLRGGYVSGDWAEARLYPDGFDAFCEAWFEGIQARAEQDGLGIAQLYYIDVSWCAPLAVLRRRDGGEFPVPPPRTDPSGQQKWLSDVEQDLGELLQNARAKDVEWTPG
jgi:hypothetical protein